MLRERRRELDPATRAAFGERMAGHFFLVPELASAGSVMLYAATGAEAPTAPLAQRLWEAGKTVCLPRLVRGRSGEMEAVAVRDWGALVPGPFQAILEPPAHWPALTPKLLDVVVVPGLGFDRAGRRIGQGGGYYDRFLARLPQRVIRVGWAFGVQVVDELPADPHDQGVDMVITEDGVLTCSTTSRGVRRTD